MLTDEFMKFPLWVLVRGCSLFFAVACILAGLERAQFLEIRMRAIMASREAEGKQTDLPDKAAPDIVSQEKRAQFRLAGFLIGSSRTALTRGIHSNQNEVSSRVHSSHHRPEVRRQFGGGCRED
jgi:hypothetical protein